MVNNNYNFGLISGGFYHLKFSIVKGVLTCPENQYVEISISSNNLIIYALQDISLAFSQNCINPNYTPTILSIQTNPTYISKIDSFYQASGDACDLLVFRCVEKGYGLQLPLTTNSSYNIELLIS